MRLIHIFLILFLAFLPSTLVKADSAIGYHRVKAKPGDGIIKLLSRYDLYNEECNVDKFYELNKIDFQHSLIAGRKYYLPVVLYTYNSVSIRSTIGDDDWDKAKRIAAFNSMLQKNNLRSQSYQRSKILWVPFHELGCKEKWEEDSTKSELNEREPIAVNVDAGKTVMKLPMFGPLHENVRIRSNKLNNKVFYVVSGHGGPDPGAMASVNNTDLCEDEYAYDVSLRLAKNLIEQGAIVHMVIQDPNDGIRSDRYLDCDNEELCLGKYPIPLSQIARLKQRVGAINDLHEKYKAKGIHDQTVICIHVDSRSPAKRQDVFFYYYKKSKSGKQLALNLHDTFESKYKKYRSDGQYFGTVTERPLYLLKFTDPKAVYVELANIRNHSDRRRLMPESNRQALANWLYDGLVNQ